MGIQLSQIKFLQPFIKNKDAIAIDIGTSSLKIVYLKHSGTNYQLNKWGIFPFHENTTDMPPQEKKNLVISILSEFFLKEKITTKNIVSSVSGNQVIVRYVKFPKLTHEELKKTLQFEAEPYIPFDIQEVDLGYHILSDVVEDGQKKMETILVATKKELVQSRLEIFNDLNLRPVVIDLDVFALQNAYELNINSSVSETALLINIGASVTNIAIMDTFKSKVVRDVFIGGNTFTKAIQRNLSCDIKTAENLKFKYTLLVTAEEKEKTLSENQKEALQVSNAITPIAKDLLGEIQRSIDFYVSQNPEKIITRILLSGGSSKLKGIDNYLHQGLKIPVEYFNPLQNVMNGENIPLDQALELAIVVGLAMRRENDITKK